MKTKAKRLSVMLIILLVMVIPALVCAAEEEEDALWKNGECRYTYVLSNFYFCDDMNNIIESPVSSCYVNFDVMEMNQTDENDTFFVASYDNAGRLIKITSVKKNFETRKTESIKVMIDINASVILGNVKVFAWDNLSGMKALSNIVSRESPEGISGEYLLNLEEKYALIDEFVSLSGQQSYRAKIYTSEKKKKTYFIDSAASVTVDEQIITGNKEAVNKAIFEAVYNDAYTGEDTEGVKKEANKRIIKYTTSCETDYITSIEFLPELARSFQIIDGETRVETYSKRRNAIGYVKLHYKTNIYDAINYTDNDYDSISDLNIVNSDILEDGTQYMAYAYGDRYIDGTYPIALITDVVNLYDENSRFVVVTGNVYQDVSENGKPIYKIPVFYKGEETQIMALDETAQQVALLKKGDVFMFLTDSNGLAERIDIIFDIEKAGASNYNDLVLNSIVADNETAYLNSFLSYPDEKYLSDNFEYQWDYVKANSVQIVFGPVMAKGAMYYSVGKIAYGSPCDGYTGLYTSMINEAYRNDGLYDILYNLDTDVYEYDYSKSSHTALSLGTTSSIIKSSFAISNTMEYGSIIPWYLESDGTYPNLENTFFALALVVDGVAVDVLTFISE